MTDNKPIRSYMHPVDAKIIRLLDRPALTSLTRMYINFITDTSCGPMLTSAVTVNDKNFPWLYEIIASCASTLNIPQPTVLISGGSDMSAFTVGADDKPFIVLSNMLVKSIENHKDYLRFIIGHECGHIAVGHLVYNNMVNIVNNALGTHMRCKGFVLFDPLMKLVLNVWARRADISADRAGLLCCGDLEAAQRALVQLEMGLLDTENLDISEYLRESNKSVNENLMRRVGEYTLSSPIYPKRLKALKLFADSALIHRVVGLTSPEHAIPDDVLEAEVERLINVAKAVDSNGAA